jgi:acyl carrier protein
VAAAVVVRSSTLPSGTQRELQDVVRARLAEHKVPHRVLLVERLPRNDAGKVLKRELCQQFATAPVAPAKEPRNHTAAVLLSIWAGVLEVPEVGVDDDFFALGGHSLAAAQIVARLRDAFGVDLPVAAVFEAPTVAELARRVEEAARGAPAG